MVTAPTKDEQLDFSKTVQIEWTSVSTDPSTFNLVLVDQDNMTPITISSGVKTSAGSFSLTGFDAAPGSAYKFNFMSADPENTGILAQSQTFSIIKSGSSSSSSDSVSSTSATASDNASVTASPTGTAATVSTSDASTASTTMSTKTKTSTGTPSKTGSASGSGTANASSTAAAPTKTNAAVALNGKTFGVAGGIFAGLLMLF